MNIRYIDVKAHSGGLTKLTILVDGDRTEIADKALEARTKPHELKIVKKTKKRSLDANAYYWVLVDKLSCAMGTSTDEMHRWLMGRYGTMELRDDTRPLVFSILSTIDPQEVTPYSREIGRGTVNGKEFTHYAVLKESKKMNTNEFSRLLDGCISECKEVGVETLPPEEIMKMGGYAK